LFSQLMSAFTAPSSPLTGISVRPSAADGVKLSPVSPPAPRDNGSAPGSRWPSKPIPPGHAPDQRSVVSLRYALKLPCRLPMIAWHSAAARPCSRGGARISVWGEGAQIERQRHEKGVGCWEGVSPFALGVGCGEATMLPLQKIFIPKW